MLNKKIVAAAVAAAFTQSAVAVVDIDETTIPQQVTFASELVTPVAGIVAVDNTAGALNITVESGFSITSGTSKYMRFDFTGATFDDPLNTATFLAVVGGGTVTTDLSVGGLAGDDFAVYEVETVGGVIASDAAVTFDAPSYFISSTGTAQVCYSLYETALQAVNNDPTQALKTACQSFAALGSAYSGVFAKGSVETATTATDFKLFKDKGISAAPDDTVVFGSVGVIDATGGPATVTAASILVPNVVDADGNAINSEDLIDATLPDPAVAAQVIRVDGDFSFGTWSIDTAATCDSTGTGTVAIAADTTKAFGVTAAVDTSDLVSAPWYVCVTVDGTTETINKSDYSVTLVDSALSNPLGSIIYDTTSIEVPYLTTFDEYKQRIYLINKGTSDAAYKMEFTTEVGITATDGPKATGVVPAGKMLMINAAEAVTLTGGKTRTAATIDVEGVDAKIQAAVQSVNLETGDTDTVVLNANSITSPTL
jgi:hypothetical protein